MYPLSKYFSKKTLEAPLSTKSYSFLSKRDVEAANDRVEATDKQAATSRMGLKYNSYTLASLAKYF